MRLMLLPALSILLAVTFTLSPAPARAQPEVILILPENGAELAEAPRNIHLCFAQPVDNADDADFRFRLLTPEGTGLGLRIVFQPDGLGVDIQPGLPEDPPDGEWTFEWRVSDAVTKEPTSGTVSFQVRSGGGALDESPPPCTGTETTTPLVRRSPDEAATPAAPPDGASALDEAAVEDEDGGGLDAGVIVLVAISAAAGAAVSAGVILLARRRVRRPPGDES